MSWIYGIGLPLLGTALLFWAGKRFKSQARYQFTVLPIALGLYCISYLTSPNSTIFRIGDLSAPAHNVIGADYAVFTFIAFVITTLVVYLQLIKNSTIDQSAIPSAIAWSIPFSAMNALSEELIFRATVMQSLIHVAGPILVATISAVLFGIPHYFGNPGKLPGVLMAGFLGFIASQSIFDTGGLGWAWAMHFVQDIPIIAMMFLVGIKTR